MCAWQCRYRIIQGNFIFLIWHWKNNCTKHCQVQGVTHVWWPNFKVSPVKLFDQLVCFTANFRNEIFTNHDICCALTSRLTVKASKGTLHNCGVALGQHIYEKTPAFSSHFAGVSFPFASTCWWSLLLNRELNSFRFPAKNRDEGYPIKTHIHTHA